MSEHDKQTAAFLIGFAAALAELRRLYHLDAAIANVAIKAGLDLAAFEAAGVAPADLAELRKALPCPEIRGA